MGLLAGFCLAQNAFGQTSGFSTVQLSWGAPGAGGVPVPALGTYGALLLALLMTLLVYRSMRGHRRLIRILAPTAAFGLAAAGTLTAGKIEAALGDIVAGAGVGEGSQSYTVTATPPPCFINDSGSDVQISYTLVAGAFPSGAPLPPESCAFDYFCFGSVGDAVDGAIIPSDGQPRATAFCAESFN